MPNDVVTLTELLGKPKFLHPTSMDSTAEKRVLTHVMDRRTDNHFPVTTDDLTTLVECHAAELDLYADLADFGAGVEGLTLFVPGGKPIVKVAATLSGEGNENRLRSTLAHELGHVLLHDPLFQARIQASLFDRQPQYLQVCYRDGEEGRASGDLFEYQAWFVCGALLMPITELTAQVSKAAQAKFCHSKIWQHSGLGRSIIDEVAGVFRVSRQLSRIRLLKSGLICEQEPDPVLF